MIASAAVLRLRGLRLGLQSHPPGLAGLYFTELWERFSYYGMRALLTLFMVAPAAAGGLGFKTATAGSIYGTYTMAVYLLAVPGGFIADRILGAKRSVLIGGTAIAAGHYALAIPSIATFYAGLALIALGTGLFKPNISALVGALYGRDDVRRDAGFSLFYMGINIGAFFAPLVTGFLAQSALFKGWLAAAGFDPANSWHWGFGAAGIGMTISMLFFARNSAGLKDPDPPLPAQSRKGATFTRDELIVAIGTLALLALALLSDVEGLTWLRWMYLILPLTAIFYGSAQQSPDARRLAAVGIYFIAAMIFWAVFEQAGTTLSLFADTLTQNRGSWTFVSVVLVPIRQSGFRHPADALRGCAVAEARTSPANLADQVCARSGFSSGRVSLMVPAAGFASDGRVSPLWLIGLYLLFTVGELMLSPVGLSTMTRIAPKRMTGFVLGLWFLAAAFGNKLAGDIGGAFTATDPDMLVLSFLAQAALVAVAATFMFAVAPIVNRLADGNN